MREDKNQKPSKAPLESAAPPDDANLSKSALHRETEVPESLCALAFNPHSWCLIRTCRHVGHVVAFEKLDPNRDHKGADSANPLEDYFIAVLNCSGNTVRVFLPRSVKVELGELLDVEGHREIARASYDGRFIDLTSGKYLPRRSVALDELITTFATVLPISVYRSGSKIFSYPAERERVESQVRSSVPLSAKAPEDQGSMVLLDSKQLGDFSATVSRAAIDLNERRRRANEIDPKQGQLVASLGLSDRALSVVRFIAVYDLEMTPETITVRDLSDWFRKKFNQPRSGEQSILSELLVKSDIGKSTIANLLAALVVARGLHELEVVRELSADKYIAGGATALLREFVKALRSLEGKLGSSEVDR